MIGSAPVATTTLAAVWRTPLTSTAPGPASRPSPREQIDAAIGQPLLGTGVRVVRDHVVAPGERGRDVDLCSRRGVIRIVHGFTRTEQGLGRYAGPVGALAADELALDDGDAQTPFSQRARAVLAGSPGAEDDDVVVGHVGSVPPVASATMYAAYHSGQFSSARPVRFSCSPCAAAARSSAPARSPTEL